jgi:fructose/tagatose bisphosphate aldolase
LELQVEKKMVLTTQMSTVQNYILNLMKLLAYEELSKVSPRFTIAAAFGNVHDKPGNKTNSKILKNSQDFVQKKFNTGPTQLILFSWRFWFYFRRNKRRY